MNIKEQFDYISENYDKQRRSLLPCFDDYYNLPLTVLDYKGDSPKILDIGCGTGLFSSIILQKYPNAKITMIDLSDEMIDIAKQRFKDKTDYNYIIDDYTKYEFNEKFDIIISALSIHHLSHKDKEQLYHKCYKILNQNGIFINADQVLSPSNEIEDMFTKKWKESVENSGLDSQEIARAYERTSFDNPSTLADQIAWLNQAGFTHVDVLYKYYYFCVFYAKK